MLMPFTPPKLKTLSEPPLTKRKLWFRWLASPTWAARLLTMLAAEVSSTSPSELMMR